MVNARGSELLIVILICFHPLITNCDVSVSEQYWHQGCYAQNIDEEPDIGNTRQHISDSSKCASFRAVECARACLKERYKLASVGSECLCLNNTGQLRTQNQDVVKCSSSEQQSCPLFPCCPAESASVFLVEGPYISEVKANVNVDLVIRNRAVVIETVIKISKLLNISKELENDTEFLQLNIEWTSLDFRQNVSAVAEKNEIYYRIPITFTESGPQVVDVYVTNKISLLSTTLRINVLDPSPLDLEIVNLVDLSDQPSCLPEEFVVPEKAQFFSVFQGANFSLEVSVAVGENVTFTFEERSLGIREVKVTEVCNDGCSTIQWFQLQTLGVYQVWVTAENTFGKLSKSIYVVVMERRLSNLRFSRGSLESGVVPSGTAVEFLIQVEIHSRFNSTLTIDVLDGHTHVASLEDTSEKTLALNCSSQGEMYITSSYGMGCVLHVKFQHAFVEERNYRPRARVKSGDLSVEGELDSELIVMHRLSLTRIVSPGACSVNQACEFDLQLEPSSRSAEIMWTILQNNNSVDTIQGSKKLSYVFQEAGCFHVEAVAENSLSRVEESTNLHVMIPVSDLVIHCEGGHVFSGTDKVVCQADVMEGSNVQFAWNVKPAAQPIRTVNTVPSSSIQPIKVLNANLSSEASFVFQDSGLYNISVSVFNGISKLTKSVPGAIQIQEEIQCVVMKRGRARYPRGVVVLQDRVLFLVKTCGGSQVQLEFDIGEGRKRFPYIYIEEEDLYEVYFTFTTEGSFAVVVYAFNHVSEVHYQTRVLVQRSLVGLTLTLNQKRPHVGSPLVIKVLEEGRLCRRNDLVYVFRFSDGKEITTASPAVTREFSQSGSWHVNVTATNLVDKVNMYLEFSVRDEGILDVALVNSLFNAVNQPIEFQIQGIEAEAYNIEVRFGDDNPPAVLSSTQWDHVYTQPGMYEVSVVLHTVNLGDLEVTGLVIVQEELQDVIIDAPSFISIDRITREHRFEAMITDSGTRLTEGGSKIMGDGYKGINSKSRSTNGGSQILYTWSLNGRQSEIRTVNWIIEEFDQPGKSVLVVEASNDLGDKLFALQEVRVQYPVMKVTLSPFPTIETELCDILVSVTGSREVSVDVDFGDGVTETFSSSSLQRNMKASSSLYLPKYSLIVQHRYDLKGHYEVKVNVSNHISWAADSVMVEVGEGIGNVTLEVLSRFSEQNSTYVVSISDPLVVRATVTKGDNLTFTWDFSEYPAGGLREQYGNESSSTATYAFSMIGLFRVSVRISSPFYREPQEFPFRYKFKIVEEIQGFYVEVIGSEKTGAALKRINGVLQTGEVTLKATCEKGSHITFLFDFGDGTTMMVPGMEHFLQYIEGTASHRYTQEGAYNITATAINPLGNKTTALDRLFYVQTASHGLKLDRDVYNTKLGDETVIRVNHTEGSNVTFDWKLGDQFDVISDAGPVMRHTYQNRGTYTVTVIARNKVSSQTDQAVVVVQSLIQGVKLTANANVIEVKQVLTFMAETVPEPELASFYTWNLGDSPGGPRQSLGPVLEYSYRMTGRFIVTVGAYNDISRAESPPLEIFVQSKVTNLKALFMNDYSLVNTSLQFGTYSYSGSNLTYIWDFGDGSPLLTTMDGGPRVRHTYTKMGRYIVTLTAYNQISSDTHRLELFVVDRVCKLPEFDIHSQVMDKDSKVNKVNKLFMTDKIHFEAEVTHLHCEYTNVIEYQWSFQSDQSISQSVSSIWTASQDPALFQRRVLKLPPGSLKVGNYTISLTVKYAGTIVYATKKESVEVVQAPLVAHIQGGALRQVAYRGNVTLNGTKSRDPNLEFSSHLRYNWTCSTSLSSIETNCFQDNISGTFDMSDPVLTFPVSWLQSGNQYLFVLEVSASGLESGNTTQVIDIHGDALEVSISCPLCELGNIREGKPIRMEAVCPECAGNPLVVYKWTLSVVLGYPRVREWNPIRCMNPGNSKFELWRQQNTSQARDWMNSITGTPTISTTPRSTPLSSTEKIIDILQKEDRSSTTETEQVLNPEINEDRSTKSRVTTGNRAEDGQATKMEDPFPFERVLENTENINGRKLGQSQQGGTGMMFPVNEGSPGEVGSSDGRLPGDISEGTGDGRQNNKDSSSRGPSTPDPVNPDSRNVPEKPPISLMINRESNQVLVGFPRYSRALFLAPGQLLPARAYIVTVTVEDGQRRGEARETFFINEGPSKGACEVGPDRGEEFNTKFKVFCKEWQAMHQPIRYQVTFDLGNNQSEVLLYQGLKKSLDFTLPAGLPHHNYKVFLKISVLDGRNAAIHYCSTSVTVHPARVSEGRTDQGHRPDSGSGGFNAADDILSKLKNQYAASLYKDDGQTRISTLYLAHLLNRGDHPQQERLLQELLRNLMNLRIEDEVEVLQTLQALVQLTANTNKMTRVCLATSTSLLNDLAEKTLTLYTKRQSPVPGLLLSAVEAGSNIVKAVSMAAASQNDLWFYREKLTQSIQLVELFLRNEIQYHMIGEQPIRIGDTAFISAVGGVFQYKEIATLDIDQSRIVLPKQVFTPQGLQNLTKMQSTSGITAHGHLTPIASEKCVRVEFIKYLTNPYQHVQKGSLLVNSEVTTLNMYDCHGNSLEDLQPDDPVSIQLPRKPQKATQEIVYTLQKSSMNVHQFNLSRNSLQQTLQIHIQMSPAANEGRLFPTTLLIGGVFLVNDCSVQADPDVIAVLNVALCYFCPMPKKPREKVSKVSGVLVCDHTALEPFKKFKGQQLVYKKHPTPQRYLMKQDSPAAQTDIRVFLPSGFFNVSGEYYLGFVDAKYNAGRPRPGEVQHRNYTLTVWQTQCLYWREKENRWSRDGCWATDMSTYAMTHCRCNHLSTFGAFSVEVFPVLSLIPVDTFFDANENPVCVTLTVMALIVYVTLMVLCHRADRHDARKGGILYLRDNALTDKQKFEVIVETGFRRGAGTTAKISIILHGEEGMSGTRELISDDDRPMFERNSRDKFILTLPESIGKIWKVQIWHNNVGSSPSWYLSRVIVKDLNNEREFYFISEKWLAVEEEDGKVEREFLALDGNLGFKRVFLTKGTQYLADYHLWLSPFTCPSYSQFTRTQRLTCCLTLFSVYTCLNTLVYHYTYKPYRGEFGLLLDLSWNSVIVGVVCCVVAIPLNFVLSFLFRRSKLVPTARSKTSLAEDKDEDAYPSGKPNENSQEEETDTSAEVVQPIMTYSILDQSILNWPAIQNWAQKQWIKRQQTVSKESQSSQTEALLSKLIGSETDMASSGFEDSNSTEPQPQMTLSSTNSSVKNKTASESSQSSANCPAPSKKNPNSRLLLPTWMQYVTWFLCAIIIVCSTVLTIWIGFRFDEVRSILWLQSLYISVLFCIFVVHPILIFIAVLYTTIRYRCDPSILDHYEESYFGENAEREIFRRKKEQSCESWSEAEELEKAVAARQRSRYLRFARPPQEKQLIESRKKVMKEKKALTILLDIVSLVVTFLIVLVMAYGKDISPEYHLNKAVTDHFIRNGSPNFTSIKFRQEWYDWASTTFMESIYKENPVSKQKRVLQGYIIGHVQLRKVKATERECAAMNDMPYLSLRCRNISITRSSEPENSTFQSKSSPYLLFGRHGIYDNSGHVIKLNHSRNESVLQIQRLASSQWMDDFAKAVFVEFTLFHPSTGLFTSVILYLEIPDTGGVTPGHSISSTYLFKYTSGTDNFLLFCELLFILQTLWKLKIVVYDIVKLQMKFLHYGWKVLQSVLSLVSVAYIGCNIYRFILVSNVIEQQRTTYNEEFVDVSFVTFWDEMLRCMVGFILFGVILQSLRLLRYERLFLLFGKIYSRAHRELKVLAILLFVLLLGFAALGHALFGAFFCGYVDMWSSIFTVSAILSGRYVDLTSEPSLIHATRMFIFFLTVFGLGLSTIYVVSFLTFRFHVTKRRQHKMLALSGPETLTYYWRMLHQLAGFRTVDTSTETESEPDNTLPPEFTMAEIEYQVDELFYRIAALSGSHTLPEKPTNYFTDSDGTYGAGDDGISSAGSEVHDEERLEHRVHKIEDNLCSKEPYLAQLFGTDSLSKDQENQIRSHLELEIFRQLQIQRQTGGENETIGADPNTREQETSPQTEPKSGTNNPGKLEIEEASNSNLRDNEKCPSSPDSPESVKNSTEKTKKPAVGEASPELCQPNAKPVIKAQKCMKKPELPAKPTFINPGTSRGGPLHEIHKPQIISSPTLRQLKADKFGIRGEKGGAKGESNSGSSITESSSGSEQDALHGHVTAMGKRNLRKTKSRGKGKGPVNLSSVLLDEIESELQQRECASVTDDKFVILEQEVLEDIDDENLNA